MQQSSARAVLGVAGATEFCTGRVACATSQIARAGVGLLVQREWLHVQNQTTFLEVRPVARAEYVQFWSNRSLNISRQECSEQQAHYFLQNDRVQTKF